MSNKIDKKNVKNIMALSHMQKGILYHCVLESGTKQYFVQLSLKLSGIVNSNLFAKAWEHIILQNEMLNAVYAWKNIEHPVQIILKNQNLPIKEYDFSYLNDYEKKSDLLSKVKEEDIANGFDLNKGPLFRIILCKLDEESYEMIISNHHIIYDGWSSGVILKEFIDTYKQLFNGINPTVKKKYEYKEYINLLQQCDEASIEKFWSGYLEGFDSNTNLPLDHSKERAFCRNKIYKYRLDPIIQDEINKFTRENKITPAILIYATWGLLLQRYNNTNDVLFGITTSGRPNELNIENAIGLFINTLPLRVKTSGKESIIDFLHHIERNFNEVVLYEQSSLTAIKKSSSLEGELFDSIVVMENYPLDGVLYDKKNTVRIEGYEANEMSSFDLTLCVLNVDGIVLDFNYNLDLFEESTIKSLSEHFEKILMEIVASPHRLISDIEMITESEKMLVSTKFMGKPADYPCDKTLNQIFEEQIAKNRDKLAVIAGEQELTYGELNEKANQLARYLRVKGVKVDQLVGIMADRSFEMIIGIIAIIKAGGAYLPIDPEYPEERVKYMLEDSKAEILLVQGKFIDKVSYTKEIINLDDSRFYKGDSSNLDSINGPNNLLYSIYTSGSTGNPKGTMIEHRSLISLLSWRERENKITSNDVILQSIPITFDLSVWEIFSAFYSQATLCLLAPSKEKDPETIIRTIEQNKVTIIDFVPSMFNAFLYYIQDMKVQTRLASLRLVSTGGEELTFYHIENFNKYMNKSGNIELYNVYGPTETTIVVTYFNCVKSINYSTVPIGKPVDNTRIYIVDQYGKMQPPMVPGELCILGDSVGRGYLNKPELTRDKFIESNYEPGLKMYKTGDLACWLPDGEIKFLGRIDNQVKVRGYRIELGEIENTILEYKYVKEAAVVVEGDQAQNQYLVVYIVPTSEINNDDLKNYLKKILPNYMIPQKYIYLKSLPLTFSGKIDRKKLKNIGNECSIKKDKEIPRDEIEQKLSNIWSEVLKVEDIGTNQNFIELGGHSLSAIQLSSKIFKDFGIDIPIKEYFNQITIKEMAQLIKVQANTIDQSVCDLMAEDVSENKLSLEILSSEEMEEIHGKQHYPITETEQLEYYPLSSAQTRLFVQYYWNKNSTSYNIPAVLRIEGKLNYSKFEQAMQRIIKRHESLRTKFEMRNGKPVQIINDIVDFNIQYEGLENQNLDNVIKNFIKPFDLATAPLIRVKVVQGDFVDYLLFDVHHIISDGASIYNLIQDFVKLYEGQTLDSLPIQYKDYTMWQKRFLESEELKDQEKYWLKIYEKRPKALKLPTDYEKPQISTEMGDEINFELSKNMTTALNQIILEKSTTAYMFLLSVYSILLAKYSQQDDIIIGTPMVGRSQKELEPLIGFFVNTIPLRIAICESKPFTAFLQDVKQLVIDGIGNQYYPIEKLIEKLELKSDLGGNSLFNSMFYMNNDYKFSLSDVGISQYKFRTGIAKYSLELSAMEKAEDNSLSFQLIYNSSLFRKETMKKMTENFMLLINAVIENPNKLISDLYTMIKE